MWHLKMQFISLGFMRKFILLSYVRRIQAKKVNIQQKVKETPNIEILPFYEIKKKKATIKYRQSNLCKTKQVKKKNLKCQECS